MATEVWFRNPRLYIRECAELAVSRMAWDRGFAIKKHIDPLRWTEANYPASVDFRLLMVGDQGTAELRRGYTLQKPFALYPTWEYANESIDALEDLLERNTVPEQEHRVLVIRPPEARTRLGREFYALLSELQESYPHAILHVHGIESFRYAFGLGYRAADIDPYYSALHGSVQMPNGKECRLEDADQRWVRAIGYEPRELKVARNRCMFNIRSAEWAGRHYTEEFFFRAQRPPTIDTLTPPKLYEPESDPDWKPQRKANVGDRFICDLCSLQKNCKLFRVGAVCTLPGNQVGELAKLFNSRDSEKIVRGLGALLAKEADRVQGAIEREDKQVEAGGEYDPQVTAMMKVVFEHGVKLAKLVDPKLAGGTKVQVNVGAANAVANSTPQQMAAAVFAQLEEEGMKREDITAEVVAERLELMAGEPLDA